MFKNKLPKLIISLITIFLIISCQNTANNLDNSRNCQIIDHDFGETEICQQSKNIAVLAGYQLAQLLSLDYQPYGLADFFDFNKNKYVENLPQNSPILGSLVTTKPFNLGTANNPSLEIIAQIQPDLILGETRNNSQYKFLSQIAPTLLFKNRTIAGKWQTDLKILAQALNVPEKAEKVIQEYETNLAQAKADLQPIIQKNNQVLLLAGNSLNQGLFTLGKNTDLHHIFTQLGFEVITLSNSQSVGANVPISLEKIPELAIKADYIFLLGYNTEIKDKTPEQIINSQTAKIKQEWFSNPLTKSLPASKKNQVYFVSYSVWNGFNSAIASNHILSELKEYLLNNQ